MTGKHGSLDAKEQPIHPDEFPPQAVKEREGEHDEGTGQDEQSARHETAADAMKPPADIGGQLLRLRPGQQGAEVERIEKRALVEPTPLIHDEAMEEGDLPCRPAEGEEGDLGPQPGRLAEADGHGIVRAR
jgi:hypothetical protein